VNKNKYVIVGESDSRRVQLFKDAVVERGEDEPRVVSFLDLISGTKRLESVIESGDVVRIESPGKDFEVERALLRLGIQSGSLTHQELESLCFDRGLILPQSQWYRGWCSVLGTISEQLRKSRPHILMNSPEEIAILFDKQKCQEMLVSQGVRMPAALGVASDFDNLLELMNEHNCKRVFLKPAHGSSASGIVAYEFSGDKHKAISTVELVDSDGRLKLYNSRKVRSYSSYEQVKTLVDALCAHNVFVQKWYPKANIGGKVFDLRVVVVNGKSRHVVVRESKTPFTNLHLLNARGQLSVVQDALGADRCAAVLATAEKAAHVFPNCLYVGVDVLISSDFRNHAVAEVNAFGDLLPGVLCDGISTYAAELNAVNDFGAKLSGAIYV